jgi:hypothetical protein
MTNPRLIDLTGKRFSRWTVIEKTGNTPRGAALWMCICICGTRRAVIGIDLRNGKSKSCGCLVEDVFAVHRTTHGGSKTPLYRIWKAMHSRCASSNPDYGGRGISVCNEWQSFEIFRRWALTSGYRSKLSIERSNVDGNYEPSNCVWIPFVKQAANRRIVLRNDAGIPWCEIAKAHDVSVTLMHSRVHDGWPIDLAATIPKGTRIAPPRKRDARGKFS